MSMLTRLIRHLLLPGWSVRKAFPAPAMARIQQAIARAESRHGGQIRFAVEAALHPLPLLRGVDARDRALEVFSLLRVWDTEHNNGVLIYLLLADRQVEIVADRGVHAALGAIEWERICRDMEELLRTGRFEDAALAGIDAVSRHLQARYPRRPSGPNELSDAPVVIR